MCRLFNDVRHGVLEGIAACFRLPLLYAQIAPPHDTEQDIGCNVPEVQ